MAGRSKQEISTFHRANKNRPREMSSKQPVPMFRDVFQVKRKHYRDPRFDDLSGSFNQQKFEESYSFIKDIKAQEKEALEKELEQTTDGKRKQKIKFLLQRIKNKEMAEKAKEEKSCKEAEKRESVIQTLKAGKTPYYLKKSEERRNNLVKTFEELKKSGKLEKYMERKRKKQFSKDRKKYRKNRFIEN